MKNIENESVTRDAQRGQLDLMGVTVDRIAEFLDDWHVPMLKRYTHEDLAERLASLGFPSPRALTGGNETARDGGRVPDTPLRFLCRRAPPADPARDRPVPASPREPPQRYSLLSVGDSGPDDSRLSRCLQPQAAVSPTST